MMSLRVLCIVPLLPPLYILSQIIWADLVGGAADSIDRGTANRHAGTSTTETTTTSTSVGAQLLLSSALGILGHVATHRLIPNIKHYMLKRGICGKDLGKKGTESENDDV
jgi:hypothetical protein